MASLQENFEEFQQRWKSGINEPDWDPLWVFQAVGASVYHVIPNPNPFVFFVAFIEYEGKRGWIIAKNNNPNCGCAICCPLGVEGGCLSSLHTSQPWPECLVYLGVEMLWEEKAIQPWTEIGIDGLEPQISTEPMEIMPLRSTSPDICGGGGWHWPLVSD